MVRHYASPFTPRHIMLDVDLINKIELSNDELNQKLEESPSIKLIKKKFKLSDPTRIYELSSILTLLISSCLDDGKINQLEHKYLLRELKDWYKFKESVLEAVIDLHIQLAKKLNYSNYFNLHYNFIAQNYNKEQKTRLFENITILLRSDLELSEYERSYATKIGELLSIPDNAIKEELMKAGLIIEQKLRAIQEAEALSRQQAQAAYIPKEIEIDL